MNDRPLYFDKEGNPIDTWEWTRLHSDWDYVQVANDEFEVDGEQVRVSTVWLGLDHNFSMEGPPAIFETMVFGGPLNEYMWRHSTETEAKAAHVIITEGVVKMAK